MMRWPLAGGGTVVLGGLGGGAVLLTAALALLPNGREIAAAKLRALGPVAPVILAALPPAAAAAPRPTPAMLAERFAQGRTLSSAELAELLAHSIRTADADSLSRMADQLGADLPQSTARISWDIVAGGRPAVAREFFEKRPDRGSPSLWRLRFELHRQASDTGFARALVRKAAARPGSAPAADLVEAAYALGMIDTIVAAAERGAIPRLSAERSLDLVRRAVGSGDHRLVARIDRAGTPDWRRADPWLAIALARKSGDGAAALRFAALLPPGQAAAARKSIIMASGNRAAIRDLLLAEAGTAGGGRPAVVQQLLETGFRGDAIALLRQDCAGRPADDPLCRRLLYLMGPRPDADGLAWLRSRAGDDSEWLDAYIRHERPAAALAFVEARPGADSTPALVQRLALAGAARDRKASARALDALLDGRALTAAQLKSIEAHAPPRLDKRHSLALIRARVAAGAASPTDRLDLAWDAWNARKPAQAFEHVQAHLEAHPDDRAAIRLMADIEAKRRGEKAARPWLERVLAATPPGSRERAEILERLGRKREAITLVEALREQSPRDQRLSLLHARLLIATGDPGRARKVLQP